MTPSARTAEPTSPALASAAFRTAGAALLGAGIWVGVAGPLGARPGLLAVALFVGWLVGSAARAGAGARASGPRGGRVAAVAVGGALFAWALALIGIYVYSLATIPDLPVAGASGGDLLARLRATPIDAFYAPQFGPLDVLEGILLVGAAGWSAR